MRVGIYAPYNRSETTAMAARLATEASQLLGSVSWLAPGKIAAPFDLEWDHRVCSVRRHDVMAWALSQQQIVWFEPRPDLIAAIAGRTKLVSHFWVPSWHQLRREDLAQDPSPYEAIVFPSHQGSAVAHNRQKEQEGSETANFFGIRWPGACRFNSYRRLIVVNRQSVTFVCPAFTIDIAGSMVLYIVDRLLSTKPTLFVKFLCEKTWPAELQERLDELFVIYGDRLTLVDRPTVQDRLCALANQDCVVDLALRRESGLAAGEYLALGLPVISFDIPPATEILRGFCRDLLLPCNLELNWFGAPRAIPELEGILSRLQRYLMPHPLNTAQIGVASDRTRIEPYRIFTNFWRTHWGLPTVSNKLQIPDAKGDEE